MYGDDGTSTGAGSTYKQIARSPGYGDMKYRWPYNNVQYFFDDVGENRWYTWTTWNKMKTLVRKTLKHLRGKLNGCINFSENRSVKNRVRIKRGPRNIDCRATLGYNTDQEMYIELGVFCTSVEIEHEFLHVLGVLHTHMRSDRDNYVTIVWENIIEKYKDNSFKKVNAKMWSNFGLPYDYESVMHYRGNAFGRYQKQTIKTKVFIG